MEESAPRYYEPPTPGGLPRLTTLKTVTLLSAAAMFPVLYAVAWVINPGQKLHVNISALFQHRLGSLAGGTMLFWVGLLMAAVEYRNRASRWRPARVTLAVLFA